MPKVIGFDIMTSMLLFWSFKDAMIPGFKGFTDEPLILYVADPNHMRIMSQSGSGAVNAISLVIAHGTVRCQHLL